MPAGAGFTWTVVYVLLAAYLAMLAARRGERRTQYATFAVASLLAAAHAFFRIRDPGAPSADAHVPLDPEVVRAAQRAVSIAAAASAPVLHAAATYAELDPARRRGLLRVAYGAAAIALVGLAWPTPALIGVAHVVILALVSTTVLVLVRAYLAGAREALLACVGAFVLAGTAVNDAAVDARRLVPAVAGAHALPSMPIAEFGFCAFVFGLSYSLLASNQRVSDELVAKGAELRRRARQLRKAYEELRAAQEELVRKEQLALVGELAAVVSHEVRNPLAIISNAVAGLRRDAISAEDRHTLLAILEEETDRLNRLVGDLLRYARPLSVERRRLELDVLLERAAELSRGHDDVRLELDLAPARRAETPAVGGDANLLRQVFDNLVQNACQAMSGGGVLTVRAVPAVEDGAEGVAIEVGDTGEGMDTQVRSRAGTPFFTTRPGGTGLGLAICDRIVTAHGGVLSIRSRAGEGTMVRVFLPAHRESEAPGLRSSNPPPRVSTVPPVLDEVASSSTSGATSGMEPSRAKGHAIAIDPGGRA